MMLEPLQQARITKKTEDVNAMFCHTCCEFAIRMLYFKFSVATKKQHRHLQRIKNKSDRALALALVLAYRVDIASGTGGIS
jgi:hypothetical protein